MQPALLIKKLAVSFVFQNYKNQSFVTLGNFKLREKRFAQLLKPIFYLVFVENIWNFYQLTFLGFISNQKLKTHHITRPFTKYASLVKTNGCVAEIKKFFPVKFHSSIHSNPLFNLSQLILKSALSLKLFFSILFI